MYMQMKPTLEQRLQKASIAIMAHKAWIAMNGVFMLGTKRVEYDPAKCPTAYTDGINEVYGAEFIEKCSDANLRFLMIHEAQHKMRRDLRVHRFLKDIDPHLANMAMDYVINSDIIETHKGDGFAKMDGPLEHGCYDPKYKGWPTVKIFNDLRQQQKNGKGQGQKPLDDHGWDADAELSEAEANEIAQEIAEAIRQGAIVADKLGNGASRGMEELLHPPVDWRAALQEFISETCSGNDYSTWRRPHRRGLAAGVYLPSGESERVGRVVYAGDMSGSIGNREQAVFVGAMVDCVEQVKPDGVDVIWWDTEVAGHEAYGPDEIDTLKSRTKPVGGGGTDVTCVPPFMQEHDIDAQCAIVLTDGHLYGGWGDWPCPVLWIILDNPGATPPNGAVVHVNSADL